MTIWRPYTQMLNAPDPFKVVKAQGSHLFLDHGQKVLDGISSWWLITHGHCHPVIAEAIAKQAEKVDQVVFANFTHEAAEGLVDALSHFLPRSLSRLFFSDNGSTSVEVAMKMAYQYHAQTGKPERTRFLAFEHAYHGDTCGAMSVTGNGTFTQAYSQLRFDILRCKQGTHLTDSHEDWISDFREKISTHGSQIAAVIIEPLLQGAGGMIVWPIQVLQEIGRLCQEQEVLLIFDEVMTGFGRTGSLFAFEQINLIPDFLCLSKGLTGGSLPLALTATTDRIYEAFLSPRSDRMLFHGHSFTGNAISCAAAQANLKVFRTTPVLEQIKAIEKAHHEAINKIKLQLPLKDSRILGPIGVIELSLETKSQQGYGTALSKTIATRCLNEGVFIRLLGEVIYLMPPYGTSPNEVTEAWDIISQVCRHVLKESI